MSKGKQHATLRTKDYNKAINEYSERVYSFLLKNTGSEELSKDVLQECFAKLWENRKKVDKQKVKSWLYSDAYNTMLNTLKRERKFYHADDKYDNNVSVNTHEQFEHKDQLDYYLKELPAIQRSILLLRDLEGYPYNEISELLNLTESQVKVYLFRARKRMKDQLKSLSEAL